MAQEGEVGRVCVAVVVGTPAEAAAFVRRLEKGGVRLAAGLAADDVLPPSPMRTDEVSVESATATRSEDEPRDELDLAIIHLRESAGLTPSECLVFALRARGFTNIEIADVLDVADRTVKSHVNHAMRKIGEGRRARPARVLAQAIAAVRGQPIILTRDHGGWLRPLRIALRRLEPKVVVRAAKAELR